MLRLLKYLGYIAAVLMGLTACGGSSPQVGATLPLAADKPTFLFFYTDN